MTRARIQGEQPLWRENAHGDIWQEPQLFDQGASAQTELDTPAPAGTDERDRAWTE